MKAKIFLAAAILFTLSVGNADAQITKHSRHERSRIKEGVKSGELTRAETINLVHDQRDIHRDVKAARADGRVTKRERREIRGEQRKASHKIYRKKHNGRDRG